MFLFFLAGFLRRFYKCPVAEYGKKECQHQYERHELELLRAHIRCEIFENGCQQHNKFSFLEASFVESGEMNTSHFINVFWYKAHAFADIECNLRNMLFSKTTFPAQLPKLSDARPSYRTAQKIKPQEVIPTATPVTTSM